ncbi:hypothetical protein D3C81_1768280 [compost metagenome]
MGVVINPYPGRPGIIGAEDASDAVDLGNGVQRHIALARSGFTEADQICFLHIGQLGEAGS